MAGNTFSSMKRREFLKAAGAATVLGFSQSGFAASGSRVSILIDASDSVAAGTPVKRAAERLQKELTAKGVNCAMVQSPAEAKGSASCIVVAGSNSQHARSFSQPKSEMQTESIRLISGKLEGTPAILVSGIDTLGYVYGLLELAERVQFGDDTGSALHLGEAIEERPANEVRCVSRYIGSEIEDKGWYLDKDFWPGYLDTLVAARFNRFCFAYGLQYDFPRGVTDDYLHLPYPWLMSVPGYEGVRVVQLADAEGKRLPNPIPITEEERRKNFDALKLIASETAARGLHFQLGIWTHAYQWTDSPNAYHRIEGLTPETHAAYCRDALAIILKECPEIQGLTMRVHGESGIPEGSWPFWTTLFEAIAKCGRTVEIDMHAKGVNQTMIDIAVATGMPVKLGAKYSAEHQSLGYNQADIRALEIPKPTPKNDQSLFSLSGGSRLFTRYGYGDFLHEGSKAKILYRLWPGSQRHLLSADPEMAAAYGRTSHFCGATGIDLMEPLTFKGREGSGHPDGRCAYADKSLNPQADWQKFEYYYRVWGRKLYNPDDDLESAHRSLKSSAGLGAHPLAEALASSSRIIPLVTSAHLCSASNHDFWPEINVNMPIAEPVKGRRLYWDSPEPRCFATVSPLDPQMFSTVVEHVEDLLDAHPNPKYTPIEVAQWLESLVDASSQALGAARGKARDAGSPEFRRMEEDILIMNGIGAFFAAQLRSASYYTIFQQTGNAKAGELAVEQYKKARENWAKMAERAAKVYMSDVSYGSVPIRRGCWIDRLTDIDADLADMQRIVATPPAANGSSDRAEAAIKSVTTPASRHADDARHAPPSSFHPGQSLSLSLKVPHGTEISSARLHYRHVNQGERWLWTDMEAGGDGYTAEIPNDYTSSVYPLEYYFELRNGGSAWLHPAFNATLSNQPYYAISKREG